MAKSKLKGQKKTLWERIFPVKYDFEGMLHDQAVETAKGTEELCRWLEDGAKEEPTLLVQIEKRADDIRHVMEYRLQEAFSTPFDRQDIYSISRQMDQILNFSLSTAIEMRAFKVEPAKSMVQMAEALDAGAKLLIEGVGMIRDRSDKASALIRQVRAQVHVIEDNYIQAMAVLFDEGDAIQAMRNREIYHHLRDAGRNMNATADVLHRIIVELT
ncbi:MAG: DUF47 family protein [Methanomassiliicoccales archaeon]|jgi:uncharacterized protein Yka (UPF0111/DUF47 family)